MPLDRHQVDDFANHWDQCIVSVNGRPYFVGGGVDRRAKTFTGHAVTLEGYKQAEALRMEDVQPYDLPAGFYQYGGNAIVVYRLPERSVRRGLCSQNTVAGIVAEAGVPLRIDTINLDGNRLLDVMKTHLKPPVFKADDWETVNTTIRQGYGASIALGREFAVVRRRGKDGFLPTLVGAGGVVGRVSPKMEIILHPKVSYLKDNLDACIQTSFKEGESPRVSIG